MMKKPPKASRVSFVPVLLALSVVACASGSDQQGAGGDGDDDQKITSDPGSVELHRLNNTEYNNTVRDLLGTSLQPASEFLAEEGLSFDNTASALGMTAAQYKAYFNAALSLVTEAAETPAQLARFMTCAPVAAAGDSCAQQVIANFGARIYRRPLDQSELARALSVYDEDVARGASGTDALLLSIRAMLSAANFLYRVELDPDPNSTVPHLLSGYELASRLSYLHWSSMPDDALFESARDGSLLDPLNLERQVDRMLADGKAAAFVESFAGQWLDLRKLATHSVAPQVFASYSPALADAMRDEGYLWFREFLSNDRPLSEWFTADFNYVNDTLATHYGFTPTGSTDMTRVEVTTDHRRGFFGLAGFLTHSSYPSRTSPTVRGAWVQRSLLCTPIAAPPNVPKLDDSATPMEKEQPAGTENVKVRLERHRSDGACAGCHKLLDPIGLGLEQFDGIGRYREAYGNGDAIDPAGVLPDGTTFSGADQLGQLVGQDPRFAACVANKLYTYALGRDMDPRDQPALAELNTSWLARGSTLRNLIKEVVRSPAFRFRRGEAP